MKKTMKMDKGLLYYEEHASCSHYVSDYRSCFKYNEFQKDMDFDLVDPKFNHLIFILDGEALISCNEFLNREFRKGDIIFLPKSSKTVFRALSECSVLSCLFDVPDNICDKLNFQSYWKMCSEMEYDFEPVPIVPQMEKFVDFLVYLLKFKINCEHFHEIKQKEMFLIFRWFYEKQQLARLFFPIIGKSLDFKALVLENYLKVQNVDELARLSRMGRSNFDNTFKMEFGVSARQWMLKQTANHVRHHLMAPGATISDVMIKFGFNSATHFTRFCKQQFGCTPTELMAQLKGKDES